MNKQKYVSKDYNSSVHNLLFSFPFINAVLLTLIRLLLFFIFSVYLHHETTQCFVKQSRDFVVLAAERVEVSSAK